MFRSNGRGGSYRAMNSSGGRNRHQLNQKNVILFIALAVSCLFLYHTIRYSSYNNVISPMIMSNKVTTDDSNLDIVLKRASMKDKTIIITTLNQAWTEPHSNSLFDIFLESFRIGEGTRKLLNHLVVVSLDPKAHTQCKYKHPHCFAINTSSFDLPSSEENALTPNYIELMWIRIHLLTSILEMGYNFVFSLFGSRAVNFGSTAEADYFPQMFTNRRVTKSVLAYQGADVVWLRNPFPHFYPDADFQILSDRFIGSSRNLKNSANAGFKYVKSNKRTIELYKFWYESKKNHPGLNDQDVLNKIKFDPYIKNIGITMRFLDTAYFSGFCEVSKKDFNTVCTIISNCCFGVEAKVHDLRLVLLDWRKFMELLPRQKLLQQSWSGPPKCSFPTVSSAGPSNFYDDFEITWGHGAKIHDNGKVLTLNLDKSGGSGFQSKKEYLFGKIDMRIKLVPGYSAGTVTAYYLSSKGANWDEIDFEFLGNVTGEPYTLHTNVFSQGNGDRERQFHLWFDPTTDFHTYSILWNPKRVIFYADDVPIREFKNLEYIGIPFPKNQPMRIYSSLWNADSWATQGGRIKIDWKYAPFTASYSNFTADACIWAFGASSCDTNSPYSNSNSKTKVWLRHELDIAKKRKMRWVEKNHMVYDYCKDHKRFPHGPPLECSVDNN